MLIIPSSSSSSLSSSSSPTIISATTMVDIDPRRADCCMATTDDDDDDADHLLYHIFVFLADKNAGLIDGRTIRSIRLVCHQWKSVMDSHYFYRYAVTTPVQENPDPTIPTTTRENSRRMESASVYRSLQMQEEHIIRIPCSAASSSFSPSSRVVASSSPLGTQDESSTTETITTKTSTTTTAMTRMRMVVQRRRSLMGFVKLEEIRSEPTAAASTMDDAVVSQDSFYFVRERTTGHTFLLSMRRSRNTTQNSSNTILITNEPSQSPPNEKKRLTNCIIRYVYRQHFQHKDKFLHNTNDEGLTLWNENRGEEGGQPQRRIVQWYRAETITQARAIVQKISFDTTQAMLDCTNVFDADNDPTTTMLTATIQGEDNCSSLVRHLMELEHDGMIRRKRRVCEGWPATIPGVGDIQGRPVIVDWMAELVECFDLDDRTFFQAMLLFDRYTSVIASNNTRRSLNCKYYQLIAGSCVLLASKCNHVLVTEKDIVFCCDNVFTTEQVLSTETEILQQLDFKLAYPSSMDFYIAFSERLGIERNSKFFHLGCYILELSLFCDDTTPSTTTRRGRRRYRPLQPAPSQLAAATIVLTNYCLDGTNTNTMMGVLLPAVWSKEGLEEETGWNLLRKNDDDTATNEDNMDALSITHQVVRLSEVIQSIRRTVLSEGLTMIETRYSKPSRNFVAGMHIPVVSLSNFRTS